MNFFKKHISLFLVLFLFAGSAFAQGQQQMMQQQIDPIPADSVTDQDLTMLVDIYTDFQPIMTQAQEKQNQILQQADSITVQRFNQIMQAQQSGQTQNMQVTPAEQRAIQRLQPKFQQLSMQVQQQQMEVIDGSEMELQRFQRMNATIQSNTQIRQRFQTMMSDTTEEGGNGNGGGNR